MLESGMFAMTEAMTCNLYKILKWFFLDKNLAYCCYLDQTENKIGSFNRQFV